MRWGAGERIVRPVLWLTLAASSGCGSASSDADGASGETDGGGPGADGSGSADGSTGGAGGESGSDGSGGGADDGGGPGPDEDPYGEFEQDCSDLHPGHPNSPDHHTEHHAMLDLFPDASDPGVVEAVADGAWSSPQTWSSGEVPTDGDRVLIPCGRTIWYDQVSEAHLDRVGVHGILHVRTDLDTRLVLDTLLVAPDAIFTVGLPELPVEPDVKAEIIIHRDNGPIDPAEDPSLFSKGVISHGTARVVGADKVDFLRISAAHAGDDTFLFEQEPAGWRVGDKLVVAATSNTLSA